MTRHDDPTGAATREARITELLDTAREARLEREIAAAMRDLATRQRHLEETQAARPGVAVINEITREASRRAQHAEQLEHVLRAAP